MQTRCHWSDILVRSQGLQVFTTTWGLLTCTASSCSIEKWVYIFSERYVVGPLEGFWLPGGLVVPGLDRTN